MSRTKPLTPVDREGLRRLATEATPGPWRECGEDKGGCICRLIWSLPKDVPVACGHDGQSSDDARREDVAFIAAANPAAVLALVNELDERDRLLRECRNMLPDVLMEAAESDLIGRIDQALGEKP